MSSCTDQRPLLYSRRSDHGLHIWCIFQRRYLQAIEQVLIHIEGGFNIMRYGAGPSGPMRTLGQYMLGSGATFGYVAMGLAPRAPCHISLGLA